MMIFLIWIVFIRLEQKINGVAQKLYKNKDICNAVMSSEANKILEFNQYHKIW